MTMLDEAREDRVDRARAIEWDMREGNKRTPADLEWYVHYVQSVYTPGSFWRHRESQTVYELIGFGLACTGKSTLVLMAHYKPEGCTGPCFERQHVLFLEKFEPVSAERIWVRV